MHCATYSLSVCLWLYCGLLFCRHSDGQGFKPVVTWSTLLNKSCSSHCIGFKLLVMCFEFLLTFLCPQLVIVMLCEILMIMRIKKTFMFQVLEINMSSIHVFFFFFWFIKFVYYSNLMQQISILVLWYLFLLFPLASNTCPNFVGIRHKG